MCDIIKPMSTSGRVEKCLECGEAMVRVFTTVAISFGWRLSERSLYGGRGDPKEELERAI